MDTYNFIATSTFGLEATVKREVSNLGFENVRVLDGRVDFTGGLEAIPKANLWLRSADRVLLNIGEFSAYSFEELFEKTKALPWDEWIDKDDKFTVTGKSVKSKLFSISDCQSIVKKAVVEKLKSKHDIDWFEETGAEHKIQVGLLKDLVTMTIDTTGPGLHKRGYRETAVIAPLKETLASAIIELSYWKKDRIFLDPTCGSGTITIEAALMAKNIAPGLSRTFVSEDWVQLDKKLWKDARKEAYAAMKTDVTPEIYGYDYDSKAIQTARYNSKKAGVDDCIRFETRPLSSIELPGDYGVIISNPPYGLRLGETEEVEELYRDMGKVFRKNNTWSVYVITSHEGFERLYGAKASAKRKLFNGMIKTDYYQFFGPRPPKA